MSWPGGPSRPKMLPPAGFKKGLARHRPSAKPQRAAASNQALREQPGQENCVAKNTSQRGGLRSLLPGAEF
jgi:hypothetical protein